LRRCSGTQFDPEVVEAFAGALAAVDDRAPVEAFHANEHALAQLA
jgi:HD-GYP domain-containing protein (c-di-GMP phosphodiesterase class II)